jgi:hypothetical protein
MNTPKRDRRRGTAHLSQPAYINASAPSLHRPGTRERSGVPHHTRRAQSRKSSVKRATSTPMQRRPVSQQTPGSLTGRPPSGPSNTHPFGTHGTRFTHGKASSPPEGNPATASSMARNWRAILGRAFPHRRHHHHLILEATAHHWERQHRNQPRARPLGGSRADLPLLPQHTRPAFRTRGGQQPTEGQSKRDGSMAVDRRATSGRARPPPSRAGTSQRRTAARRHHGLAAPRHTHTSAPHRGAHPSPSRATTSHQRTAARRRRGRAAPSQPPQASHSPHHSFSSDQAAFATMRERRDHHARPPSSTTTRATQAANAFAKAPPLKHFASAPGLCAK